MPTKQPLSYTADLVRQYDRDRFLTALFAPENVREDLLTLYAFNVEIARIRETVTEPMIGQMRLQWWRDQITEIVDGKGASKGHPVAEPLAALFESERLSPANFLKLLEAREQDMADTPPSTVDELVRYCHGTSATLAVLGLNVLGVSDDVTQSSAKHVGTAWALSGVARSVRHRALAGHVVMLPGDDLEAAGLTTQDLQSPEKSEAASNIVKNVSEKARDCIALARDERDSVDLRALPVLLQATLAASYLKKLEYCDYHIYDPRLRATRPAVAKLWWNAWRKRY